METNKNQELSTNDVLDIGKLLEALSLAQGEIGIALKHGLNPHFKSPYAQYRDIWEAVKGPLSKHGLSYSVMISGGPDLFTFTGMIGHKSGQLIKTSVVIKPQKAGVQELGSLSSYMKRYLLSSLCGVAEDIPEEDDDGNSVDDIKSPEDVPLADTKMLSKKYADKTFKEVSRADLMSYLIWFKANNKGDHQAKEFIKRADDYLLETAPKPGNIDNGKVNTGLPRDIKPPSTGKFPDYLKDM